MSYAELHAAYHFALAVLLVASAMCGQLVGELAVQRVSRWWGGPDDD